MNLMHKWLQLPFTCNCLQSSLGEERAHDEEVVIRAFLSVTCRAFVQITPVFTSASSL